MTERTYIGNSPFFYEKGKRPQQIATAVTFVAFGLMAGWSYAFAMLLGAGIWSVSK